MASTPDDPQRTSPDEQAKQGPTDPEAIPLHEGQKSPSDSAIDLDTRGEDDLSGVSVIEWAKLIESPASDSKAGLEQGPTKPREEDIAEILAEVDAALPEPPRPTTGSDSAIDLTDQAGPAEAGARPRTADDSSIDLMEQARAVEKRGPLPRDDSAIELGDAALVSGSSVLSDDQALDLGPDAVLVPEKRPGEGGGSDSEIDLGDPTAAPAARQRESDVNFLAEDIVLESGSATSGSSRDLVAEKIESGVDLVGKKEKAPATRGDSIEDDFLTKAEGDAESSSVDLGSMHAIPVFDEAADEVPEKTTKRTAKPASPRPQSSSEIDLDLGEAPAVKPDMASRSEVDLDLDSAPDIETLQQAAAKKKEPSGVVAPAPPAEPTAQPPRRGMAASVAGGLACGLAGAALALGGAYFGGFLSSGSAAPRQTVGTPVGPAPAAAVSPPPVAAAGAADAVLQRLRAADFDRVAEADLEQIDAAKAEQLVARAQYRWLKYQAAERGKDPRAALRADAEAVKSALADLEKALSLNQPDASADALFLRAEIHEMTGNAAAARAEYQAGAAKFAADPTQKLRFETALQLLEMDAAGKVGQGAPALPPRLAALVLIAFQPPAGGGAAPAGAAQPPALPPEAGFAFWQAVKQAKAGNYAEALRLLDEARTRHDQRRYLLPRKQQNPLSDPRERLFLHACDELKGYWGLLARLSNPNYLAADSRDRVPQVEVLLTKAGDRAAAALLNDLAAKLAGGAKIASADDLVQHLAAERKARQTELAGRDATIRGQKQEIAKLGDKLKEAGTLLARERDARAAAEAGLKQSQAAGDEAVATLKEVAAAVSTPFTDVKSSKESLLREVRNTVKVAKTADPKADLLKLERDLAAARARLAERWEPAELLSVWLPLLDRERGRKDLAVRAEQDARRVLADPATKPEVRGQALLVQGLALRNEERFREAVPLLEKAREALQGAGRDLLARCEAALKEASDPVATVAARAGDLAAEGKQEVALQVLARGLKGVTGRRGPLLVQRCKIAFEAARSKGALHPADPLVVAARADAAAAASEGLPEGLYCLGRLDEELGRLDDAERHYRAALKAHGAADADGSRYRVALARVLLRQRAEAPPGISRTPLRLGSVGVLLALTIQAVPSSGEAEALADEVLALGDKAPFTARAQALAIKGLHTQALKAYVAGLRDDNKLAAEHANTLLDLINAHPRMRRVESVTRADPVKAEQYYSAGLNAFFARSYAHAEKEMLAAVENDSSDARYFYFLGLARLAQGKREAYEDFEQGKRLEEMNRPDRAAVSSALERVQGRLRRALNEVREAPAVEKVK